MSKITYDDKVALNVNSNIADINKVNASDMNEIKTVVNNNANTLDNLLSNTYGTSQTEGYSQEYINNKLASSEWVDLGNTVYYKKCGNIITVTALSLNDFTLVNDDYTTVATLPAGARPTHLLGGAWALGTSGPVRIKTTGEIQLYTANSTSYWSFTITFII
jgi:hypothetical protein